MDNGSTHTEKGRITLYTTHHTQTDTHEPVTNQTHTLTRQMSDSTLLKYCLLIRWLRLLLRVQSEIVYDVIAGVHKFFLFTPHNITI